LNADWESVPTKLERNVQRATTEDLLDRLTAFRAGLDPRAIPVIEAELRNRGITAAMILEHGRATPSLPDETGVPRYCQFCRRPASHRQWGWHWFFGVIPLFPRRCYRCEQHQKRR
jgi:hypothetical protein